MSQIKVYTIDEIQTVYKQHAYHCGSVLYSEDKGFTWNSVPMDSGKWKINRYDGWIFAFIERGIK